MSSAATIRMCHCGVAHAEGHPCAGQQPTGPLKQKLKRFTFRVRNVWNSPTALAVWYLSRRLQRDKAFRDAWHANIAMPINDATRPQCTCKVDISNCETPHQKDCPVTQYWVNSIRLDMDECNKIADRLMEHLFRA